MAADFPAHEKKVGTGAKNADENESAPAGSNMRLSAAAHSTKSGAAERRFRDARLP
jgi:hypothetical protein